jgi:LuxR family maltose regulon positive regulatory protein
MAAAEPTGWMSTVIECCVLQSLVSQAQGERVAAQHALVRALQLGQPENYIRLFVDEGEPMRLLLLEFRLAMVRKLPEEPHLLDYVDRLLAAFPSVEEAVAIPVSPSTPKQPPVQNLVEPLTERELEILRMVSDGLSNREIADRLIVTVGTVKKHLNNIFGKLDVTSRTQALVSARVLNLL